VAFAYYKSATTDHTQAGSSDSTNFPLTIGRDGNVQAIDTDLKTVGNGGYVQNANGYDIRPYADAALTTPLTFELVYYNASTGALEMHVNMPTLHHSTNDVIYLAFGDATISTDGSSTATWNSNYKLVYHLPDGTTLTTNDSTSNAFNASNNGSPTAVAGQIDGGASFNGSNQNLYVQSSGKPLGTLSTGSFTAWFNASSFNGGYIAYQDGAGHNAFAIFIPSSTSGTLSVNIGSNTTLSSTKSSWTTGTMYKVKVTWDGTTAKIYINGALDNSFSVSGGTGSVGTSPSVFGSYAYGGGTMIGGQIAATMDEIRISAATDSADWETAEFHSQQATSTFLTWGSKVPVGGSPAFSASDTTAVTDVPTIEIISYVNVADTSVMSDAAAVEIVSNVSVSDTTAVTDSVKLEIFSEVSVADTSVITDVPSLELSSFINVFDSTIVTDVPSVLIPILKFAVSDQSVVSDVPNLELFSFINVSDSTTMGDVPTVEIVDQGIVVSDITTMSDAVQIELISYINVSETTVISDVPSLLIISNGAVNVLDQTTVTDSVQLELFSYIALSDQTVVSAVPTVVIASVAPLSVNVSDSTTMTDVVALEIISYINVADTSVVTDTPTIAGLILYINVSDSSTITDVPTLLIISSGAINVADSTVVTDTVQLRLFSYLNVSDLTPVVDTPNLQLQSYLSVADQTVITDTLTLESIEEGLNVSDTTIVTDTVTLRMFSYVSVVDTTVVSDTNKILIPLVYLSVFDQTVVGDTIAITEGSEGISVFDTTVVTDSVTITMMVSGMVGTFNVQLGFKQANYTMVCTDPNFVVQRSDLNKNYILKL
jgi:hypothetical protein